jgi:pSer/pThr/pTyr-binding forkhead associated (FHA) protein
LQIYKALFGNLDLFAICNLQSAICNLEKEMTPKLIEPGTTGSKGREIAIHQEEFLIGRGADCDLRLKVTAVSRHHCLLRFRGQEASVTDLGSSNGTFVNGQRVRSQTTLHSGDEIRVGTYQFVVDLGDRIHPEEAEGIAATCKIPGVGGTAPKQKD